MLSNLQLRVLNARHSRRLSNIRAASYHLRRWELRSETLMGFLHRDSRVRRLAFYDGTNHRMHRSEFNISNFAKWSMACGVHILFDCLHGMGQYLLCSARSESSAACSKSTIDEPDHFFCTSIRRLIATSTMPVGMNYEQITNTLLLDSCASLSSRPQANSMSNDIQMFYTSTPGKLWI